MTRGEWELFDRSCQHVQNNFNAIFIASGADEVAIYLSSWLTNTSHLRYAQIVVPEQLKIFWNWEAMAIVTARNSRYAEVFNLSHDVEPRWDGCQETWLILSSTWLIITTKACALPPTPKTPTLSRDFDRGGTNLSSLVQSFLMNSNTRLATTVVLDRPRRL
jgi:hypothetical protein